MWPLLTNLLQIHFPTVKPPHIATPKAMYISTTFYLSTHCWKISQISLNFFPDFGSKTRFSPYWKKFSKFPLISVIGGNPENRGISGPQEGLMSSKKFPRLHTIQHNVKYL